MFVIGIAITCFAAVLGECLAHSLGRKELIFLTRDYSCRSVEQVKSSISGECVVLEVHQSIFTNTVKHLILKGPKLVSIYRSNSRFKNYP